MSDTVRPGYFIAFEGGEGAGKSTQAKMLADALSDQGIAVDITREPGGTIGAEAIRKLLLNPPQASEELGWGARAEALLFAAARSDHVEKRIRPAIAEGNWVICDRFVDSSRAYQGGAGGLGDEAVCELHEFGSEGLRPDLTILLQGDAEALEHRVARRDGARTDAIGGRGADYHRDVAARFASIAAGDPEGFAVIDASMTPDEVHNAVMRAIALLIEDYRS